MRFRVIVDLPALGGKSAKEYAHLADIFTDVEWALFVAEREGAWPIGHAVTLTVTPIPE